MDGKLFTFQEKLLLTFNTTFSYRSLEKLSKFTDVCKSHRFS